MKIIRLIALLGVIIILTAACSRNHYKKGKGTSEIEIQKEEVTPNYS